MSDEDTSNAPDENEHYTIKDGIVYPREEYEEEDFHKELTIQLLYALSIPFLMVLYCLFFGSPFISSRI